MDFIERHNTITKAYWDFSVCDKEAEATVYITKFHYTGQFICKLK